MAKLLFVVHRYAPYPGGSEANTHRLAKAALDEGHEVLVLTDTHHGHYEGVQVTSDRHAAYAKYDMIIVHGSCPTQDFVLGHGHTIRSPIYYMLIEPPKNHIARELGTQNATWIGWGTTADFQFIQSLPWNRQEKAAHYVYGLPANVVGTPGRIKSLLGVTTPYMMMSAGGYWPHKRFSQLVDAFNATGHPDWSLVLFGYDTTHGTIPTHGNDRVKCVVDAEEADIFDAMADADLYIQNSESEGYGLTLLEAMANRTTWMATNIAAGHDLREAGWGMTYEDDATLRELLANPITSPAIYLDDAQQYVLEYHTAKKSLNSILRVLG